MKSFIYRLLLVLVVLALPACGGGGGGGKKKANQLPVASFTLTPSTGATPVPVTADGSSSTDPDGTIATYSWDFGDCATAGGVTATHTYTIAGTYTVKLTVTDNKGAKRTATQQVVVSVGAPPTTVAVSGEISFNRRLFHTTCTPPTCGLDDALDDSRILPSPARGVTVDLVQACTSAVLASTSTDASGQYVLDAPVGTRAFVRAKAQSVSMGTVAQPASWDISVLDNTSGNALYAIDGAAFDTGTASQVRNLNAPSGWSYLGGYSGTRAAAPFAILDTIYSAIQLVITQADDSVALGSLKAFWSENNQPTDQWDPANGWIITTSYQPQAIGSAPAGIYVLGAKNIDSDEFDQHVIAHEFQHFLEDQVGRSDSPGGPHSLSDRLDMRVAFGEGFSDAFSAMVLGDPLYRDSMGMNQLQEERFDMEARDPAPAQPGWFNEMSVSSLVWDLYDSTNDAAQLDSVTLGFGPIYEVMRTALRDGVPLTSIFSFVTALKLQPGPAAQIPAINARVQAENIVATTMNAYATTETNSGMNGTTEDPALVLPVYTNVAVNGASAHVCTDTVAGVYNAIGNRRFLRFTVPTDRTITISVSCPLSDSSCSGTSPAPDPDFGLYHGLEVQFAEEFTTLQGNAYTETLQKAVAAGDYALEIYDYSHVDPTAAMRRGRTCMNVTITG